ncbi:MAG: sialidase family protein [Pyrinomonadaceae bacterium]
MKRIQTLWCAVLAAAVVAAGCGGTSIEVAREEARSVNRPEEVRVSAESDAAEPAIATGPDGSVYVAYVEHAGKGATDVFLQKYGTDLNPAGPRVRVSPDGTAKTWKGDPPTVAAAPDGTVFVGWTRATASGKGTDLMVSASRDGGLSFEAPVKVNDDTEPASHGMHSIAVGADGRIYVAWLDERNVKMPAHDSVSAGDVQAPVRLPAGFEAVHAHHDDKKKSTPTPKPEPAEPNSEVFFSYSTDGGETFSANKKIANDVCPCCKTSMLAAPDGKLYLSWRQVLPGDLRHIAVASTEDKGETFSERSIVSDDQWRLHACPVSGAALSYAEGGRLTVTWYTAGDAGQAGVYSAESADGGRSFGPRRLVSFDAGAGTPIAFAGSQACMFTTNDSEIVVAGESGTAGRIPNAALPAAASDGGRIITAFVRPEGKERSVWLAVLPHS